MQIDFPDTTGPGISPLESNTITESPAVHGHVGDPLQIYADRVSRHYGYRHQLLHHEALERFRPATAQENSRERCLYFGDHEGGAFIRS